MAVSLTAVANSFVPKGEDPPTIGFQELPEEKHTQNIAHSSLLVTSPYVELPHLLDLSSLDTPNRLLAVALQRLECQREDYATAPYVIAPSFQNSRRRGPETYADIFNWSEVVGEVDRLAATSKVRWKETFFYIVVFRSRIPPTTLYEDLGVLDKAAHAEAMSSGGFLKYWFGVPDLAGRNLATCVWRNSHDARVGSVGEAHRRAASATRRYYSEWQIERFRFVIGDDAKKFSIEQWVD